MPKFVKYRGKRDRVLRYKVDSTERIFQNDLPIGPGPEMVRTIGRDIWLVVNAEFSLGIWNRTDTSLAAQAVVMRGNGDLQILSVAAGANPISWTTASTHTVS